jgi:hypothetical protein
MNPALCLAILALAVVPSAAQPNVPPPAPAAAKSAPAAPASVPAPAWHSITADTLMGIMRELPTQRSGGGRPFVPAGVEAPALDDAHRQGLIDTQWLLARKALGLGYAVTLEPVAFSRRGESRSWPWANVVLDLPGRGDLAGDIILVGAHFDAVPGTFGADDNASGTAALLEIARVLRNPAFTSASPRRTVRLVFFTLEEAGLIGARQHADRLTDLGILFPLEDADARAASTGPRVVMMLSLEMLGFYNTAPDSQQNPLAVLPGAPDLTVGDFIALCTHSTHAPVNARLERAMLAAEPQVRTARIDQFPSPQANIFPPDLLRSDHAPFLACGVPGIMVTDTANFRNPHYHTPGDTPQTLNAPLYERTVRALAGAVWKMALDPEPFPKPTAEPPQP